MLIITEACHCYQQHSDFSPRVFCKIKSYVIELFGKVTAKFDVTEQLITYFEFLKYMREMEIR
jgi:hypothetical protein